jgi:chaperonin GroES
MLETFSRNEILHLKRNRRYQMNVQPLDERVLVEPMEIEERVGSIIIPDTAKEKPSMGKVVAVGTDEELQKVIKVGDNVIFGKYAGEEIKIEGKKHLIMSRSDILATVN